MCPRWPRPSKPRRWASSRSCRILPCPTCACRRCPSRSTASESSTTRRRRSSARTRPRCSPRRASPNRRSTNSQQPAQSAFRLIARILPVGVKVLVGTRKGLFFLTSDDARRDWQVEGPALTGWEIMHAACDPRDGALYACSTNFVYPGTVHKSTDGGETWERSEQVGLPEDSGLKLEKLWHVRPGHADRPNELWLGGTPGVPFRSQDAGQTFEPVKGVLEHPTRDRWQPGAGGMCCHSIQLDPTDPNRMEIAISAAGAFRTDDGGETWTPINAGVAADFMPDDPYPEVGQCVHKLLQHPVRPERLWQQNHCGVSRSADSG